MLGPRRQPVAWGPGGPLLLQQVLAWALLLILIAGAPGGAVGARQLAQQAAVGADALAYIPMPESFAEHPDWEPGVK